MQIIHTNQFMDELSELLSYIFKQSPQNAFNFKDELFESLETVTVFPCGYRKNEQIKDEFVRDFIFKGYVIPFLIKDEKIHILGIYKQNIWKINP